jgi:3-oxosteroid 1-dehydrogenase
MTTVVEYDVVVVGAGAAGMTAALAASSRELSTIVIEKGAKFGGNTARSGAGIWIPNNEVILAAGVPDTPAKATAYLARVVGGDVDAARQAAFLSAGPAMISFVRQRSPLRFRWMESYSDYYPEFSGGMPNGRSIEPAAFDGNILGDELGNLLPSYIPSPTGTLVYTTDYRWLNLIARHPQGLATAGEIVARYLALAAQGQRPVSMGQALAGGLRAGLLAAGVPVWLSTPLTGLHLEGSRVTGVWAERDGEELLLKARRGVILGSGGFEHNERMRKQWQAEPIGVNWTVGAATNTGDGIEAGQRAGAKLQLMEDAWWGPAIPLPDGPYFCLAERTLPGNIFVNGAGKRFVNEAAPYSDVVHVMYEKNKPEAPTIPCWMITDQKYRNRYLFKDLPPLLELPQSWLDSGAVHKAWTLNELARKIGVPSGNLTNTVVRFNWLALTGRDTDFRRGDSHYDSYFADPVQWPNDCLAGIDLAPFYAFKIVPGDLGTKGGMLTDTRARVLREDGTVIAGLFAAGNASAAVMGHSYAGAGSTLGPAMTFGYLAGMNV